MRASRLPLNLVVRMLRYNNFRRRIVGCVKNSNGQSWSVKVRNKLRQEVREKVSDASVSCSLTRHVVPSCNTSQADDLTHNNAIKELQPSSSESINSSLMALFGQLNKAAKRVIIYWGQITRWPIGSWLPRDLVEAWQQCNVITPMLC